MPLLPTGSDLQQKITFNSGYITVNGQRLVDLQDVTIEMGFTVKELRHLNSIKLAAIKRSTFKVGLKGKTLSVNKEVLAIITGTSSVDGSGTLYSVTDGQQATLNPIFTAYIDDDTVTPKVVQYQFTDAILSNLPLSAALEDFGALDFEFMARDVNIYAQNA